MYIEKAERKIVLMIWEKIYFEMSKCLFQEEVPANLRLCSASIGRATKLQITCYAMRRGSNELVINLKLEIWQKMLLLTEA